MSLNISDNIYVIFVAKHFYQKNIMIHKAKTLWEDGKKCKQRLDDNQEGYSWPAFVYDYLES